MLRKVLVEFSGLVFMLHWNVKSAPPLIRPNPRSLLYEGAQPFPTPKAPLRTRKAVV